MNKQFLYHKRDFPLYIAKIDKALEILNAALPLTIVATNTASFDFTPDIVTITQFYYKTGYSLTSTFKDQLRDSLSVNIGIKVDLRLSRLKYPTTDSEVLAKYLAANSVHENFKKIYSKIQAGVPIFFGEQPINTQFIPKPIYLLEPSALFSKEQNTEGLVKEDLKDNSNPKNNLNNPSGYGLPISEEKIGYSSIYLQ